MSTASAKDRVEAVLQQLREEGYAEPVLVYTPTEGRSTVWVITDPRGGQAYFQQTSSELTRITPEQFALLHRVV